MFGREQIPLFNMNKLAVTQGSLWIELAESKLSVLEPSSACPLRVGLTQSQRTLSCWLGHVSIDTTQSGWWRIDNTTPITAAGSGRQ